MVQVPAAANVLAVLRWLATQAAPAPAATIARAVGLPRSTTYHLLGELVAQGFVVHLPDQRRYGLGVAAYELGHGYTRQASLQRTARAPVARLVAASRCTGHLAVLHGREVVYLVEERAPGTAPLVSDVGVRLPAHLTATGRAMLAALPAAHVRALFPDAAAFQVRHVAARPGPTAQAGPGSLSALRRLLVDVRRRGWALEQGEITPGLVSAAVAVLDPAGHPVAAVAVTAEAADLAGERLQAAACLVGATAHELRRRLGGA